MDEQLLEEYVLPKRLQELFDVTHVIFADCWSDERRRYEFNDPRDFFIKILRFRRLMVQCTDDDLRNLALYIVYNEVEHTTDEAMYIAMHQLWVVLTKMRNALLAI